MSQVSQVWGKCMIWHGVGVYSDLYTGGVGHYELVYELVTTNLIECGALIEECAR